MLKTIHHISASKPTVEGAGVHLHRVFGNSEVPEFDPFLLFDDFSADDPKDYLAGFPWHPHRGIETVTYVLDGAVDHEDSLGNKGTIGAGDMQWMNAGSGIIHQEMPKDVGRPLKGFQLWVNLPAKEKMSTPRYQGLLAAQIPAVRTADGIVVRVICGTYAGTTGPIEDIAARPEYLDIEVPPNGAFSHAIPAEKNAFAYVVSGAARFVGDDRAVTDGHVVHFTLGKGDEVTAEAGENGTRFLLVSGVPLREQIAWYGPIVMNTKEEIHAAFREIEEGTFIRSKASGH